MTLQKRFAWSELIFSIPHFDERADAFQLEGLANVEQDFTISQVRFKVGNGERPDLARFCANEIDERIICRCDGLLCKFYVLSKICSVFFCHIRDRNRWIKSEDANSW